MKDKFRWQPFQKLQFQKFSEQMFQKMKISHSIQPHPSCQTNNHKIIQFSIIKNASKTCIKKQTFHFYSPHLLPNDIRFMCGNINRNRHKNERRKKTLASVTILMDSFYYEWKKSATIVCTLEANVVFTSFKFLFIFHLKTFYHVFFVC